MVILSRPFTPPPTGIQAGTLDIEEEVLINENGTPVNYIEVGFTTSVNQYFPVDGAKLDYFCVFGE